MIAEPPIGLLAELTHRCPLQCPYCSNPLELVRANGELPTMVWQRVLAEAAELGVLQLHLSGGEPTLRPDLETLVAHARAVGLYTNLITAGVLLDERRIQALAAAGLDHVQLSFQDAEPAAADRIGGYRGGHAKKLEVAARLRAAGLPVTVNAVVHRQNLDRLEGLIELALELGAHRLEVAHAQYYGWALLNRAALMPSPEQVRAAQATVTAALQRLRGRLVIDYVVPDYYARRPKPCMGGWGRQVLNVTPAGEVMPCHAAATIPGLAFDNVRERPLGDIWRSSAAFQRFRGTEWLPEPCRSC
ncbi:MAG TPA: pyrroloquinoline quinone biosynthesis protein PqqE, partial [Geminicoccaceae bacterium]|nr:pyrroloquinoline quinone biosynthesis protein PqqE [Geminicoccaceae bacterium]